MKPASFIIMVFICLVSLSVWAQSSDPVKVGSPEGIPYEWAWAGGLNSCQFGQMDINGDGFKDLVVFDRAGNRLSCFLNLGVPGEAGYSYDDYYSGFFPSMWDWMILADYDDDGKEDIFTYSPGFAGIRVFRNISALSFPQFELVVTPYLTSYQGGGQVNILVTYADYPGISDLDGDGDLDILTFWGLGSFVEMHRNMSVEKFGHADSLDYIKTSFCWGYFAESEESNQLTLDTCIGWKPAPLTTAAANRHTGSSFLIIDLNGDGLKDLLLGDVDYPNLVALYNNGSIDTAIITNYDWNFPPGGPPVDLYSMPSAAYIDVNNDGRRELICSPFDPSPYLSGNFESIWLYQNEGTDGAPVFQRSKRNFLQEKMIDLGAGAYPVFMDYNGDGLTDLIVGNYGYYDTSYLDQYYFLHTEHISQLALLINTGTPADPSFNFSDRDFANVSDLETTGALPAFADLDGDGDPDMLLGCADGTLHLYRNIAPAGQPMSLVHEMTGYQGIDAGAYSAPCLFDLDFDGLTDLIIGEKGGNLNYYHNDGTPEVPDFNLVTDSLGKINVTDHNLSLDGYSVPMLIRNEDQTVDLLVGSECGKIFYFEDIGTDPLLAFPESSRLAETIGLDDLDADRGFRSSAALIDLDNDGSPELICGNFAGGLEYFTDDDKPDVSGLKDPEEICPIRIFPVPAWNEIFLEDEGRPGNFLEEIRLVDPLGRMLGKYGDTGQRPLRIGLEHLAPGIYFLEVFYSDLKANERKRVSFKILH